MLFCSRCGKKLSEDDYFCSGCGARTKKGLEAGAHAPADDLREAFSTMGQEMEKAFTTAAKEIQRAFKTAKENIRQSTTSEPIICSHCKQANSGEADFCIKCGEKLK
jgi:uncharacterized membrane protein YvbJ